MSANITTTLEMPIWWPDYISVGVFFFLLGVTGAAIIVYLGSWDKLMGNTARILELEEQIKSFRELLKDATDDNDKDRMWHEMMRQREELNKEKKFFRIMGIIIYLFVGGIVASILANSMLEAVALGAGWTGLIGVFGIKKDVEERMKRVDADASHDLQTVEMIKKNYEDKINKTRSKMIKEYEDKVVETYSNGYVDAIEAVAKVKGMDSKALTEEIIESL
ncbi:MAG: hypothetical protein RBT65_12695 [Methanolobus sp.]|nr:hypothetical protein [Methanolobus sp.]